MSRLQIIEVATHKVLGECDSRWQAYTLISKFPGTGSCYIWCRETSRPLDSITWVNT